RSVLVRGSRNERSVGENGVDQSEGASVERLWARGREGWALGLTDARGTQRPNLRSPATRRASAWRADVTIECKGRKKGQYFFAAFAPGFFSSLLERRS